MTGYFYNKDGQVWKMSVPHIEFRWKCGGNVIKMLAVKLRDDYDRMITQGIFEGEVNLQYICLYSIISLQIILSTNVSVSAGDCICRAHW